MRISLLQADLRWEAGAINRELFASMIDNAPQADLFLLPEMFTTGFVTQPAGITEDQNVTLEWMRQVAARKVAAVGGSVAIEENGKLFNRFYFVSKDGSCNIYDKRHLFAMGGEHELYSAGNKRVVFEFMGMRIMLLICYDLRFPVWSRSAGDCDLMLYVASWPESRIGAWDTLLKARAIENQCFVAGLNRVGTDPFNVYNGHSVVVDYLGNVIAEGAEGQEAVISAQIDRQALDAFRAKFPAWMDADKFEIL